MTTPPTLTFLLRGSCRCKAVAYTSTTLPSELTACHCVTCRKLSGGPYIVFGSFPLSSIAWSGAPQPLSATPFRETRCSDIARRGHCSTCGSPMFMHYDCRPEVMYIAMGTVDEESVVGKLPRLAEHIYVGHGENASWEVLAEDGIERHKGGGKKLDDEVAAWRAERRAEKSAS